MYFARTVGAVAIIGCAAVGGANAAAAQAGGPAETAKTNSAPANSQSVGATTPTTSSLVPGNYDSRVSVEISAPAGGASSINEIIPLTRTVDNEINNPAVSSATGAPKGR
jgi:hypothetical protein